jgi:hypothetical protein
MEKGNRDDRSTKLSKKWDEIDAGLAEISKRQNDILADFAKCKELAARCELSPKLQAILEKCHTTAGNTATLLQELIEYRDGGTSTIESMLSEHTEGRDQTEVVTTPTHSNASDSHTSTDMSSSPLIATHEPQRSIFYQWLNFLFYRSSRHFKQD